MNGAPGPGVATGAVRIFDTTLRDGEQAPGAGLTVAEKLEVARQLAKLKVDVIEAGFPAASEGDFEAVRQIAESTKGIGIAALARCKDGDPQRAIDAIKASDRPHLHLFIATSDIHLTHKLRTTREAALEEAVKWVKYAHERLGRDATLWLAEPFGSRAVREVPRPDHHRAGRVQASGQDRAPQTSREGPPVRDERQERSVG